MRNGWNACGSETGLEPARFHVLKDSPSYTDLSLMTLQEKNETNTIAQCSIKAEARDRGPQELERSEDAYF